MAKLASGLRYLRGVGRGVDLLKEVPDEQRRGEGQDPPERPAVISRILAGDGSLALRKMQRHFHCPHQPVGKLRGRRAWSMPGAGEFPLQFPHAGRRRFAHGLLKHLVHDQHGVLDFHAALEGSRRAAVQDLAAADRAVLPPVDLPAWRMAQRVFSLLAPSMLPELVQ